MTGFAGLLPPRSVEDVLAQRVRLRIDGEVYDLPVLSIAENREWKQRVDLQLGFLVHAISAETDADAILELFEGSDDLFLGILQSYDATGVLPPREALEAGLTSLDLIRAVLEVWRAARPLADITAAALTDAAPAAGWRQRMSSWLRRITGRTTTSSAS